MLRITLATVSQTTGHLCGAGVFKSILSMLPDMSTRNTTDLPVMAMPAKRVSVSRMILSTLSASLVLSPCRSMMVALASVIFLVRSLIVAAEAARSASVLAADAFMAASSSADLVDAD